MRPIVLFLLLAAAPLLAGAQATAPVANVDVRNFEFRDADGDALTLVPAGTTVVWTWKSGGTPHTVSSVVPKSSGGFDSGTHREGDPAHTFEVTFDAPGVHRYFCRVHPTMQGTIVVTP